MRPNCVYGNLKELYCADCKAWICAACQRAHLVFVGYRDHVITTMAQTLKHITEPLRNIIEKASGEIEWCCQQEERCYTAQTALKRKRVTSQKAHVESRQKYHMIVDKLYDGIDQQTEEVISLNETFYSEACTVLQQRRTNVLKYQELAKQELSKLLQSDDNPALEICDTLKKLLDTPAPEVPDTQLSIVLKENFDVDAASLVLSGGLTQVASLPINAAATAAAGAGLAHDSDGVVTKQKKSAEYVPDRDAPAVKHKGHARDVHDVGVVQSRIDDDRDPLQNVPHFDAQATPQSDVIEVNDASHAPEHNAGATLAKQHRDVPASLVGEGSALSEIENSNAQSADDDNGDMEADIVAPTQKVRILYSRFSDGTIQRMVPCASAAAEGTESRDARKQHKTRRCGAPKSQTTRSGRLLKRPRRYGEFSLVDECQQSLDCDESSDDDDDMHSSDNDDQEDFDKDECSLNYKC